MLFYSMTWTMAREEIHVDQHHWLEVSIDQTKTSSIIFPHETRQQCGKKKRCEYGNVQSWEKKEHRGLRFQHKANAKTLKTYHKWWINSRWNLDRIQQTSQHVKSVFGGLYYFTSHGKEGFELFLLISFLHPIIGRI